MPFVQDQKTLHHPIERVFDLALDLQTYGKILSYIKSAQILAREKDQIIASIRFGLSIFSYSYRCRVFYQKHSFIRVTSDDSLFHEFETLCRFEKLAEDKTEIIYEVNVGFANPVLEVLAAAVLPRQTNATIQAFETYLGKP